MTTIKEKLQSIKPLNDAYIAIKWRERDVSLGNDYPDKKFYVIRRHSVTSGLFSFAMTGIGDIVWAMDHGYVPVVDMMNYRNSLITEHMVGRHNAWDDYFYQPCGFEMQDITTARHVHLGTVAFHEDFPDYPMISNPDEIQRWRGLAHQYLKPLDEHAQAADEYYNETIAGRRVLGVLVRGTDYRKMKPLNHPIQPEIVDVIDKCRQVMDSCNCDIIYLATEDADVYQAMEDAFPGKIYSYQTSRYQSMTDGYLADELNKDQENDPEALYKKIYERNRQYLISILVLSMCNCLVAGATSGTYGALLLSDGYEYQYLFDCGVYR